MESRRGSLAERDNGQVNRVAISDFPFLKNRVHGDCGSTDCYATYIILMLNVSIENFAIGKIHSEIANIFLVNA